MNIAGKDIGLGHPPHIVAEVSGEHRGSIDNAIALIRAAKEAGADAAKLQAFSPERLAEARGGRDKVLADGLWKGRKLIDLYRETHTPASWFSDLFAFADHIGITLFSSVFDEEGVDYLETLGCPAYKISSFEVTNLPLIRKAASTGKAVIISTGMATRDDVLVALATAASKPGYIDPEPGNVALLHCVSSYPCSIADANLSRLAALVRGDSPGGFRIPVGLSDHTLGSTAAIVATALGASIIEKHITLDRNNGGHDAAFSLEPKEFAKLVQDVKDAYASLGTGERPKSEDIYRSLRHKGGE